MRKVTKDYFGNEALIIGYSSEEKSFSRMVYQEMMKKGMKVYPVNTQSKGPFDVDVYGSLDDLTTVPDTACLLISKSGIYDSVKDLHAKGVKRVLVQSKSYVSEDTMNFCHANDIELSVGCPFMSIGKGLHRFHGFLAGVR